MGYTIASPEEASMGHAPTIEDYGIPSFPAVVVTGPRNLGFDEVLFKRELRATFESEINRDGDFTLVHGNADGLDRLSELIAEEMDVESIKVPYFGWLRGAGGPARNRFMLEAYRPRRVHGFHFTAFENLPRPGSGTADCFWAAIERRIPSLWHDVPAMTTKWYLPKDRQETLL